MRPRRAPCIPHIVCVLYFCRYFVRRLGSPRTPVPTKTSAATAAADHDPRADRDCRRTVYTAVFVVVVVVVVVVVFVAVVDGCRHRVDGRRRRAARGDSRGRHTARRVQVHHHAVQSDARAGHRRTRPVRQGHTPKNGRHVQVHAKGRQVRGHRGHALRFRVDHQRSRRPVPGTHLRLWRRLVYYYDIRYFYIIYYLPIDDCDEMS